MNHGIPLVPRRQSDNSNYTPDEPRPYSLLTCDYDGDDDLMGWYSSITSLVVYQKILSFFMEIRIKLHGACETPKCNFFVMKTHLFYYGFQKILGWCAWKFEEKNWTTLWWTHSLAEISVARVSWKFIHFQGFSNSQRSIDKKRHLLRRNNVFAHEKSIT